MGSAARLFCALALVFGLCGGLIFGATMTYYSITMPDPMQAGLDRQPASVTILAKDGRKLSNRGLRRNHVRLETLPPHVVHAVLATEDRRFFHHFGVDPVGLIRALVANVRAKRFVQGGSTVTQQLVKNLFLKPERTMHRKMQEVLLALWIEMKLEKEQILELYLNHVYFGAGAHGIEAAARRYFGLPAHQISVAQAAMLAGLLKAPSKYAPTRNLRRAKRRSTVVLNRMVAENAISPRQKRLAMQERIYIRPDNSYRQASGNEYASDWVMEQIPKLIGSTSKDIIVETTIDRSLQQDVQSLSAQFMQRNGQRNRAGQVSAILLAADGGVRAVVGGRSYKRSQFNRAIKAKRQPGSAFKPFVFLAALENGFSPRTIAYDEPVSIGGWTPKNYSKKFRGAVTLNDAFSKSINSVAVRLYMDVGRWTVVRVARRLGIQSGLHRKPSLALGTAEVNLAELTAAYVPFSNGGRGVVPHIIRRVKTRSGKILYARRAGGPGRVVQVRHVAMMNEMMRDTVERGTGRKAAFGSHPVGGKTGTSQDSRDAWFVGYTAHLTAGVWVGNDTGREMKNVTGGGLPALLWRRLMARAHKGLVPKALPGLKYRPHRLQAESKPVRVSRRQERDALASLIARTATGKSVALTAAEETREKNPVASFFSRMLGN